MLLIFYVPPLLIQNFCGLWLAPSLRKHPFLLTLHRWGSFVRNICDSSTEIPYWWRKICPESGQKRWLVNGVATVYEWRTKDKRPQRSNVNAKNPLQNSQYLWNIVFSRRSIWVLLEIVGRWTQHFVKIDQKTPKIGQIYIWKTMTTGFIMSGADYLEPPYVLYPWVNPFR